MKRIKVFFKVGYYVPDILFDQANVHFWPKADIKRWVTTLNPVTSALDRKQTLGLSILPGFIKGFKAAI
jgi:hypothetical protein